MTTSLLKLAIPTEGSLDGTWGDVVNNGITQYLDIAVAGTTTLSTDADVDLTSTEGDVSGTNIVSTSAQYAVLLCSGARTTLRNINAPKQSKTYVVINNTTGGFGVVVRGGPSTPTAGVTVAAGEKAYVAWDGSDFVKVGASAVGTVTSVGGTGTVNGITLTGTVTSSGNLTLGGTLSGVNLTTQVAGTLPVANGGTGVTTSTGTGAVVLSNSPTLVTPALGTPSSGTLTNATGLPIDGGTTGTLPVNRGGTGVATLTGLVKGSGASAFSAAVAGTDYAPATLGTAILYGNGSGGFSSVTIGSNLTFSGGTLSASSGSSLTGTTNSLTPFKTALGDGAGTSTTGTRVTAVGYRAAFTNVSGTALTAVGHNALINATSSFTTAVGAFASEAESTGSNNTSLGYFANSSCTTGIYNVSIGDSASGNVTGSYNVAIGQATHGRLTNSSSNYCVAVGALALNNVSGDNNTAIGYQAGRSLSSGTDNTLIGFNAGRTGTNNLTTGSNNILIGNSAQPTAGTVSNEITLGNASIATLRCQVTSITSLSDARDKTDVAPVQDALKLVNTLNPVRFTWNTRDGAKVGIPDMGFIAQELKAAQEQSGVVVPNLVYESNPDRMEAAYGTLIPVLVKAIQELSAEVAALKAKA